MIEYFMLKSIIVFKQIYQEGTPKMPFKDNSEFQINKFMAVAEVTAATGEYIICQPTFFSCICFAMVWFPFKFGTLWDLYFLT